MFLQDLPSLHSLILTWDLDLALDIDNDELFQAEPYNSRCWVGPNLSTLQHLDMGPCFDGDPVLFALADTAATSSLIELDLATAQISDGGIRVLSEFTALRSLNLEDNTRVSNVTPLSALTKLTQLVLDGTWVSNASMPAIGRLTKLEYLSLACTSVTSGITALTGLQQLRHLALDLALYELHEEGGGREMPEDLGNAIDLLGRTLPGLKIQ